MAIGKINPFQENPYASMRVQPIQGPAFGASPEIKPTDSQGSSGFQQAVKGFAQRNPYASQMPTFAGKNDNYQNGLSQFHQGALGENAIMTQNGDKAGKAGAKLNMFA